jgi:MFS family permease
MSIFPYIYFMIESFHMTTDDRLIAIYAGMVTSAFTFAEFSSGMLWGKISDRVGRKPILLTGLAGTGLSMLVFGFAPNLPMAVFARALGGLLNGYVLADHRPSWRLDNQCIVEISESCRPRLRN